LFKGFLRLFILARKFERNEYSFIRAVGVGLFSPVFGRSMVMPTERRGHFTVSDPSSGHQFDSEGKVASGELQVVSGLKVKLSVSLLGGERLFCITDSISSNRLALR